VALKSASWSDFANAAFAFLLAFFGGLFDADSKLLWDLLDALGQLCSDLLDSDSDSRNKRLSRGKVLELGNVRRFQDVPLVRKKKQTNLQADGSSSPQEIPRSTGRVPPGDSWSSLPSAWPGLFLPPGCLL